MNIIGPWSPIWWARGIAKREVSVIAPYCHKCQRAIEDLLPGEELCPCCGKVLWEVVAAKQRERPFCESQGGIPRDVWKMIRKAGE